MEWYGLDMKTKINTRYFAITSTKLLKYLLSLTTCLTEKQLSFRSSMNNFIEWLEHFVVADGKEVDENN